MEKNELSLYTYDSNGKQLDRSALSVALADIMEPVLLLDQNNHILFGYGNGFEYVFQVYEQKNASLKQIDRVNISVNAGSSGPLQLQYDQGVLYCMQEGNQTIRIMAANHKGMLYSSEVYGCLLYTSVMKSKQPVWISVRAAPMRTASTHRRPMSVCWQRLYRGMLPGSHNGIRLKAAGIMWNSCVSAIAGSACRLPPIWRAVPVRRKRMSCCSAITTPCLLYTS